MLDIDTDFRRQVRSLSSPNSPKFDPDQWKKLSQEIALSDADKALLRTAYWIAGQSETIRAMFNDPPRPASSAQLAMTLAVATLNRDCTLLAEETRKAQEAAQRTGPMSPEQLADVAVAVGDSETKVDPGSYADAIVDTIDSWLREAADSTGALRDHAKLADEAVHSSMHYTFRRGHYDLWQSALWEGWSLSEKDGQPIFTPADQEAAVLMDACVIRHQSDFMEAARLGGTRWSQMGTDERRAFMLALTVTGVDEKPGKRRQFIVAPPSTALRHVPPFAIARAVLEDSYLAPLLNRPLPLAPDLTCDLVLKAWYVAHDLAGLLAQRLPRATFHNTDNLRRWALVVRRSELLDLFRRTLSISTDVATDIIDLLSWTKGAYKGLWGAPLVPLPESDEFLMAQTVLETSDIIRRTEIWLTKGGLDDNLREGSRGSTYEAHLRLKVREALKSNPILRDSSCADQAIKKSFEFDEQIDLLIQFGSLLLVGEVKSLLFPSDARERYNFMRKLKGAAEQASRKAAALSKRLKIAAFALKVAEAKAVGLRIVPIVVLNQGFGTSLQFGECVVTDAKFLMEYLGGKHYRDATEAVRWFETTMKRPPPLYRFIDQLRWTDYEFPAAAGADLRVARTELKA
jgi:hypothetical protein